MTIPIAPRFPLTKIAKSIGRASNTQNQPSAFLEFICVDLRLLSGDRTSHPGNYASNNSVSVKILWTARMVGAANCNVAAGFNC